MFFLTICSVSFGQKQGNIWYFGNYAGIDFNTGSPIALLNGQLPIYEAHNEGSSAISDSSGFILFYTDGMTIWNKENQIMQNGTGLLGNFSSTQSSIIVPDPSNSKRYFYVFTVSSGFCCNGEISDGLRYSKIDMCLDSLKGGIIETEKNIKLVDTVAEKIAVTRHSNGSDYWVLTHKFYSNEFWALRLTPDGITDTVITPIGSYHTGFIGGSQGQLKFSSNGRRIAIGASNGLDILDVFDFNNSTGIISNWFPLFKPNNNHASIYGVEFSHDNTKVYASGTSSLGIVYPFLVQYDLNAGGGSLAAINASMTEVYHNTTGLIAGKGLQIGPDNKIYWISLTDPSTLAVINYPNILGSGCNFQDNVVSLAGREGSYSLPSFISNFDYSNGLTNCDSNIVPPNIPERRNCTIYPNPFSQYAVFEFTNPSNEKHTICIYDTAGQLVSVSNIITDKIKIERKTFASGLYILRLLKGGKVIMTCKFIIT
jgi:large repetitive protein